MLKMCSYRLYANVALLLTLILIAKGHQPMYAHLRTEIDSFSDRMKSAFEEFVHGMEELKSNFTGIENKLEFTVSKLEDGMEELQDKVLAERNRSVSAMTEINEQFRVQSEELERERHTMQKDAAGITSTLMETKAYTDKMIMMMADLQTDFKDFRQNANEAWNMQRNTTYNILKEVERGQDLSGQIADREDNLKSSTQQSMSILQKSIENVLQRLTRMEVTIASGVPESYCSKNWIESGNSCYRHVAGPTSWKIAKFMCKQLDAFLVEFYTLDEAKFVSSILRNKTDVWIGAMIGRKGIWNWGGSRGEVNFDIFSGSYPSGRNRRYCGLFIPKTRAIADRNCGEQHDFVCRQFSIVPTTV